MSSGNSSRIIFSRRERSFWFLVAFGPGGVPRVARAPGDVERFFGGPGASHDESTYVVERLKKVMAVAGDAVRLVGQSQQLE